MDSQQIEILGRNVLTNALLEADLEVAEPLRDRGVDLLVYRDLGEQAGLFRALPIQLKAASRSAFAINAKYARISDLLIAYVWHLTDGEPYEIFALTHDEAVVVGDQMGYTATESWRTGWYSTSRPSRRLRELLEPYRMDPEAWRRRIDCAGGETTGRPPMAAHSDRSRQV